MSAQVYLFSVVFRHPVNANDPASLRVLASDLALAFKNVGATKFVFQLERGETSGRLHWQCYLRLNVRTRPRTLQRRLPYHLPGHDLVAGESIGVQPCSTNSTEAAEALRTYCMKEETRVGDKTYCEKGIVTRYVGADLEDVRTTPFPWQRMVLESIASEPDDRTINWVHNAEGNAGKSKLMKYCAWTKKAIIVGLGTATQIKAAVLEDGASSCFLVDLPRVIGGTERLQDLFSALESIKNGFVKSVMYGKSKTLFMAPPHLWIFSNQLPPTTFCSKDRWTIWSLKSRTSPLVDVTAATIAAQATSTSDGFDSTAQDG